MTQQRARTAGLRAFAIGAAALGILCGTTGSTRASLHQTAWGEVAAQHKLDPALLLAVALMETGKVGRHVATPQPYAIRTAQGSIFPESKHAAVAALNSTLAGMRPADLRTVDVGLMQINLGWQGHRIDRVEDLFEPARNLELGATILSEMIATAPGDLELGVGRYHAGFSDESRARQYGRAVLGIFRRLQRLTWE